MNTNIRIRHYEQKDATKLRAICKETASSSFKENPLKLETVPINFLDYFLEQEPEHVFVAAAENDEAVGYVECATDYHRFVKAMNFPTGGTKVTLNANTSPRKRAYPMGRPCGATTARMRHFFSCVR